MDRRTFLAATVAAPFVDVSKALAQTPAKSPALAWTQWGGPNRNFQTEASALKDTADQNLIALVQGGNLMIAHPSPQEFRISAKAPLLTRLSWTPPVLVGARLYVRDRKSMMSVDLS